MPITPICTDQAAVKRLDGQYHVRTIRCKRWSCKTCRELNRRRVIAIAVKARPNALLTLTVSSTQYPDPADAAEALKRGLRLLRLRLKRHEKLTNFRFLAVFEKHKSGHPHLHLLIKGKYIPWINLRTWWEEITGSTHVHIRKIHTTGIAAYYCAKYIGKDLSSFPGCKRWWRSAGFSEPPAEKEERDPYAPKWYRHSADFDRVRSAAIIAGWTVAKVTPDEFTARPPPDYPGGIVDLIRYQWATDWKERAAARKVCEGGL